MRTLAMAGLAAALLAFGGCKDDEDIERPAGYTTTYEGTEGTATAPSTRYPTRTETPAAAGTPTTHDEGRRGAGLAEGLEPGAARMDERETGAAGTVPPTDEARADEARTDEARTDEARTDEARTDEPTTGQPGALTRQGEKLTVQMMKQMGKQMEDMGVPTATVTIAPTGDGSGKAPKGEAMLGEMKDGVHVMVAVTGLPEGEHSVRIVDTNDCDKVAGAPVRAQTQAGATETLDVDDEGGGTVMFTVPDAALSAGKGESLVGKAIVISAADLEEDDDDDDDDDHPGVAHTAGVTGLVACGVIGSVRGR